MTFVAGYQQILFLIVTFGANVGGTPIQTKAAEISKLNSQLSNEHADKSQWISYYNAKAKTVTQLEKQVSALQQQINNSRKGDRYP